MSEQVVQMADDRTTAKQGGNDGSGGRPVPGVLCVQCAIGALVGAAVGDALGAPFEFLDAGLYSESNPEPRLGGIGEMRGGGTYAWKPGEFTDDTQMALALAESLIANRGFDAADLWARWRHWARGARDVGVQTGTVLQATDHVGAAAALHEGNGGRTAGNGSVMRNGPVGVWAASRSLEDLIELATAQATLTHHDRHNGYAASIHGAMVRAGVLGQDVFAAIDEVLDLLPADARERWAPLLSSTYVAEADASNGDVFTCLAQAVWAVRGAASFEDAVVRAIELGRDTDTVAAVAGSIAGARWGIQAIPSRWTTYLNGRVGRPDGMARATGSVVPTDPQDPEFAGVDVYDYWSLQTIARALVGKDPVADQMPDEPGGPTRVHADLPLFAADLAGARDAGDDWAVISLCRTPLEFSMRAIRRQVYLVEIGRAHV